MSCVFDTNAFCQLFDSYYRNRFPTLWERFGGLVANDRITSTREIRREIGNHRVSTLRDWASENIGMFPIPNADEAHVVNRIFRELHFQQVIERRKLQKGGLNADPFIVARAYVLEGTVVTMESNPPNGARIPNICDHFEVGCLSLEGFMEAENWTF